MNGGITRFGIFIALLLFLISMFETKGYGQSHFLTLPFSDPGVVIQQGWLYNFNGPFSCPLPEGTRCHRGIDYIKGTVGQPPWLPFDVRAAAPGKALASYSTSYGNFVYIAHDERDNSGLMYFTLYAHLSEHASSISFRTLDQLERDVATQDFSKWSMVARGALLGKAGESASPGLLHLHFEAQRGGYPLNKTDPYDIYNTRNFYPAPCVPGGSAAGVPQPDPGVLWTQCPPTLPSAPVSRIYVSVPAENRIAVVDPGSDQVIDSIPLSSAPQGIAISRDGSFLLAVLPNAGQLAKVHLPDKTVTQMNITGASAVAILPSGQKTYVTQTTATGTSVSVVDPSTLTVLKSIPLAGAGSVIDNINAAPSGLKAYVSFGGIDTTVAVIDTALDQLKASINAQTYYHDEVAFSADSSLAVVSSRGANCPTNGGFSQLDAVNDVFLSADNLTSGKIGVKVSADKTRAYLPDTCGTGNLLVFDLATNTLVDSIPTGLTNEPSAVLLFENTGKAFLVDETGTMSDVNLSARSHLTFPLSTAPFGGILPWTVASGPAPQ